MNPVDTETPSAAGAVTDSGPLRFERRQSDRWPAGGLAKAYRIAGERFGEAYTLRMIDSSRDGIGAMCSWPLEPGSVVSVGYPAPGYPVQTGVVLRCLPCGDGYRLAIRFDLALAA